MVANVATTILDYTQKSDITYPKKHDFAGSPQDENSYNYDTPVQKGVKKKIRLPKTKIDISLPSTHNKPSIQSKTKDEDSSVNPAAVNTEKTGEVIITELPPKVLTHKPDITTFAINISPQCRKTFDKILLGSERSIKIKYIKHNIYELQDMGNNHRLLGYHIKSKNCSTALPIILAHNRMTNSEITNINTEINKMLSGDTKQEWSTLIFYNYVPKHEDINYEANSMYKKIKSMHI